MNDAFDDASDIASATSSCDVSLYLLVKGGHHNLLRLLPLHLCTEYPSLKKKKRRKSCGAPLKQGKCRPYNVCVCTI